MATSTLPDVSTLSTLPQPTLEATLDLLFEHSIDLHALALPAMRHITFLSYPELIDTIRDQLMTVQQAVHSDESARKPLHAILGSHPRLGEKRVDSALSRQEQAGLKAGDGDGDEEARREAERLAELNQRYEETFPGLRYVVFVNGRARDVIMEDMVRRTVRGDLAAEEVEAIQAMCDIAKDRAAKLTKAL